MKVREFQSELWLPRPLKELFPFFADAANLDAITPPWLHFHIVTPLPVVMREGALIDYRLRVRGLPLRWRTRISVWQPPDRFVDEQLRGPYQQWIHEHTFEPRDGGTMLCDRVTYAVPLDWLLHRWLVRPDIERIFRHRSEALRRRFSGPPRSTPSRGHPDQGVEGPPDPLRPFGPHPAAPRPPSPVRGSASDRLSFPGLLASAARVIRRSSGASSLDS